jgi:microcin C transport system substrate-binding protein
MSIWMRPKGGALIYRPRTRIFNQSFETVNTLNGYVLQGDGPVRVELTFDTLMTGTGDEVDSVYGLLAEWVEYTDDGLTYDFKLRPEARFHDGSALTASDVVWSFNTLMADGHPDFRQSAIRFVETRRGARGRSGALYPLAGPLAHGASCPGLGAGVSRRPSGKGATSPPAFRNRFSVRGPIAWPTTSRTVLSPMSGCRTIGRPIMPFSRGQYNFDTIRINFYRDRDVAFEAFKAGDMNLRFENFSRNWATGYDFPRVRSGEVVQSTILSEAPSGAQGLFYNTRLEKFSDWRVRKAISLAYNFEWTNQNLQFGLFERTKSMFQNAPYMAEGLPSEDELAILEPFRDQLLPQVFEEPYVPPVSDATSQADRRLLREAAQLLEEAGWRREDGRVVNEEGEQLSIEFLYLSSAFERLFTPHAQNLALIGIDATTRNVDPAQMALLTNNFEFDVVIQNIPPSLVPGSGLRALLGSEAANTPGSRNPAGIAHPVVDALIEKVEQAETLDENYLYMSALDRVLRPYHYWMPQWYSPGVTIKRPETKPRYVLPVETHSSCRRLAGRWPAKW